MILDIVNELLEGLKFIGSYLHLTSAFVLGYIILFWGSNEEKFKQLKNLDKIIMGFGLGFSLYFLLFFSMYIVYVFLNNKDPNLVILYVSTTLFLLSAIIITLKMGFFERKE